MVGTRLRRLRVRQGLTQKELAAPRYTHAYVSTIESGRRRPSRDALEYFASKLGVQADELLTGRPPDLVPRLELRLQEARFSLSAGRLEEADDELSAIEREARRYKLRRLQAGAEEGRGLLLERQGKLEEGLEHYQRAEELLRGEPVTASVDAVAGKARCFEALGDIRYAIFMLESLLDAFEREGLQDPAGLARVHASLVYAYIEAGLYQRAAVSAIELDRLTPKLSDPSRIAQMNMNVARLHLVQGRVQEAERSLARAEDAYRLLGWKTEAGGAHLARGYVFSREGKVAPAREELERALSIFEETANAKDLTRTLNELARLERLQGRTERARELLERSITLLGDADVPILAWAHRELGLVFLEVDPARGEKHLRVAIDLYERSEQSIDIAVTYRALGDLLSGRGEGDTACEAYRTGIQALEPRL